MKKIYLIEQLEGLNEYPPEVINNISKTVDVLEENYGERLIEEDLGGYVAILENYNDIVELKKEKLKGLIPEYIDIIKCSYATNWVSILFLLSSDFSIVVVTTEKLSKFLLE